MKRYSWLFLMLSFFGMVQANSFNPNANYQTCFTPQKKAFWTTSCTDLIVQSIQEAKTQILVQAYSFTSAAILKALVVAKNRGVDVEVILDKSQVSSHYTSARYLANQGVPVWIDNKVAIAHNKVMIIDKTTVIEGSFNFTNAAQNQNAENVNIISDVGFAEAYFQNWEKRQLVSRRYLSFESSEHGFKKNNPNFSISERQAAKLVKHLLS